MSVYNRKMFKRNARNALNQSAGIRLQKFQTGGLLTASYQRRLWSPNYSWGNLDN